MNEKTVHLFTREEGKLVRINPTKEELAMGRKMAATIKKMLGDMHRHKARTWSYESVIGHIELSLQSRGKAQYMLIRMINLELKDYDVRNFLVLAVQYLAGEYPYMTVSYLGTEASIMLPSKRNWFAVCGFI
jgi:hypothetical protein